MRLPVARVYDVPDRGAFSLPGERTDCPHCGGRAVLRFRSRAGSVAELCSYCRGRGTVLVTDADVYRAVARRSGRSVDGGATS